jgi:hypothetical protein
MTDGNDIVEPVDDAGAQPTVPVRVTATGEPAGAAVEAVLAAVRGGQITSKLAREVLVRLIPPAKPTVKLRLPTIRDARSFRLANQVVMRAAAAGKIAPSDAILMQRGLKATWQAVQAEMRNRFRLVP